MKANKNIFFAAVLAALAAGVMSCPGTSEEPPAKRLVGISVTPPEKLMYGQGGLWKSAGLAVTANYDDGSKAAVTEGYTVKWEGSALAEDNTAITAEAGNKTVTVGWSGKEDTFTVRVYAGTVIDVKDLTAWNNAITTIKGGGNGKDYVINIEGNLDAPGYTGNDYTFGSTENITVLLLSVNKQTLGNYYFFLKGTQTLRLDGNLTLTGDNLNPVVLLYTGAKFIMDGGTLSGNTTTGQGAAVHIDDGTFTMNGGTISGNTADLGGGVFVTDGTFIMTGGTISGNTADTQGGGVYLYNSSFTMTGGTISGNTARCGGGVFVDRYNNFDKTGGEIIDNTATDEGTWGDAVFYLQNTSPLTYYYCDKNLLEDDDISTTDDKPTDPGEELGNWTRG